MKMRSSIHQRYLYGTLITLVLTFVFYRAYTFEFLNFDDNVYVSENPSVLAGLSSDSLRWAFTTVNGGHWHPLSWISHMIDVEMFGVNPGAMHVMNVAIHIVNCLILFVLLSAILKSPELALLSTLLWGVHPLRMESVAWISQRKDLLSLFFGLLSCLFFTQFLASGVRLKYALSLISFGMALLAKPSMMTLPLLFVIIDIALRESKDLSKPIELEFKGLASSATREPLRRRNVSRGVLRSLLLTHSNKAPFALLALICGVIAILSQSSGGGLRSFDEFSISHRLSIAFPAYLTYLGKLLWPFNTTIYYPVVQYPSGLAFACLLALSIISCTLCLQRGRYPELLLGWAWFVVALTPMVGFVTIGSQALADRWTLLAHIGLIVALVRFFSRRYPRYISAISCILIFSLSTLSFSELHYWKSSEAIFKRSLSINADNFMAHTNLGVALAAPVHFKERAFHYEEAVRLNPTYPEALNNLGIVRAQQGNFLEAIALFERAIDRNPDLIVAKRNLAQAQQEIIRGDKYRR